MKILFYRILRKIGFLKHLVLNIKCEYNGRTIIIPTINEIGFNNYLSWSEPWMLHILKRVTNEPSFRGTFIDVGANVGQTLIKVKTIDPSTDYIGFEPNPICVNYLNKLVDTNKFKNTLIFPVGISNTTSVLELRIFNDSLADSSASTIKNYRDESKVNKTFFVPVFNYSHLNFDKNVIIGVLKIDVEGAEKEVIEGMLDKINSDRPIILMEILPVYTEKNNMRISRQKEIQSILVKLNYKILRIVKQNDVFIRIEEISEFEIHSDLNMCEYIMVPANKLKILKEILSA